MRFGRMFVASGLLALLLGSPALAQVPTATLTGTVTHDRGPLPGVLVTLKSPGLQGTRSTVTAVTGSFAVPQLPPGDYTVTFAISGFQTATRKLRLSAAQTSPVEVEMVLGGVAAKTEVVAQKETISETNQVAVTISQETIDKLPVGRTIQNAVNLTPGTNQSGPAGNTVISGAMSYENLFLVNGVVVNENLRGQPLALHIEDAVQETTTATMGISAEYGRFGGGVVNVLTKSGGNQFSGSLRASLTNDDWQANSGYRKADGSIADNYLDKINPTYEATVGGPIWKDRIWFFLAGRSVDSNVTAVTAAPVSLSYPTGTDQKRYEGKLTISPMQGHSLLVNYQKVDQTDKNNWYTSAPIYDLDSIYTRTTPQELISANYSATLGNSFFAELQYSKRKFTFENSGSQYTDRVRGTLLLDVANGGTRYWSPTFCGVCSPEKRDNEDVLFKTSWFVSSSSLGSHNIVMGGEYYNDVRLANNHQSGSDYRIYGTATIIRDGVVYPRWTTTATGNSPTYIQYNPIFQDSLGTNLVTWSLFLNDTWQLSRNISFNVGLRWDKNDGKDEAGTKVVSGSKLSPRLGMTWDVAGDSGVIARAFYARYVAGIQNNQADAGSLAGQPAQAQFDYRGDPINPDTSAPTSSLLTSAQALEKLWAWYDANGGFAKLPLRSIPSIPGLNPSVGSDLAAPNTDEFTIGFTKKVGSRGMVSLDGVYRKGQDFYATVVNTSTGTVSGTFLGSTRTFDRQLVENTNLVERKYLGLNLNASFRPSDRLLLQGNYTWSHTYGSFEGETSANGAVSSGATFYPEYMNSDWNSPVGDLATDRRHKVRLWAVYDIPMPWKWLGVSLSALYNFDSGAPYGAVGAVDSRPYVTNPGYLATPSTVTYYFTARDAFRTSSIQRTDLALNISLLPWRSVEVFLQPEVLNVFNAQGITGLNTSLRTRANAGTGYAAFNPFAEKPVQGASGSGANWDYASTFGNPTGPASYQQPRVVRVSLGVRF